MYPVLENGQLIVIFSCKTYKRGDVVVFEHGGIEKVKRVDGTEGSFMYVLGDNPLVSTDSRSFGYISKTAVAGKVVWPRV